MRRRPSGEPPPLPRAGGRRGWYLLGVSFALVAVWFAVQVVGGEASWLARADAALLDALAPSRGGVTDVAKVVAAVADWRVLSILTAAFLVGVLVFRRLRLLVLVGAALFVSMLLVIGMQLAISAPRPYDVVIIGNWSGYASPSSSLANLSVILVGAVMALAPVGRARRVAGGLAALVLALVVWSSVALATDYPSPALVSVLLPAVIVVALLWRFAPDAVAPVTYGGGTSAHLDLGGARGDAIRAAVRDQLGLTVTEVEPFGLAGSGGSSPMRLHIDGTPSTVFAKLLSAQHVRADRDYKVMRALLYGRLEDERSFANVQRLVENEDYLMRVFRDAGAPVVRSYGIVEITPSREYMLVTDFAEGAREIGDPLVTVDDAVIESGLRTIRLLWDGGLAHRDVKPANLLVRDGEVVLIDLGFSQVRPSPWRQAVDLANMCLCLAARSDATRVYEAALALFTPDELAEAFAATRGLTVPTQLQAVLKADGRDLLGDFRRLAPAREPISIQRWDLRRIGLALGVLAGLVAAVAATVLVFFTYDPEHVEQPACTTSTPVLLFGQAVPGAHYVPCVGSLPTTWAVRDVNVDQDSGSFTLDAGALGTAVVQVLPQCDTRGRPVEGLASADSDVTAVVRTSSSHEGTLVLSFKGGCVQVGLTTSAVTVDKLLSDITGDTGVVPNVLRLVSRDQLNAAARSRTDGRADALTRG